MRPRLHLPFAFNSPTTSIHHTSPNESSISPHKTQTAILFADVYGPDFNTYLNMNVYELKKTLYNVTSLFHQCKWKKKNPPPHGWAPHLHIPAIAEGVKWENECVPGGLRDFFFSKHLRDTFRANHSRRQETNVRFLWQIQRRDHEQLPRVTFYQPLKENLWDGINV